MSIKEGYRTVLGALHIGPALRLVWQGCPGWTVASVLLLIVQGTLPLVALYVLKLIVDAVAGGLQGGAGEHGFGQAAFLIGIAGFVAIVAAACQSLAMLVDEAQTQAVSDHLHHILHAKSVEIDLEYYEDPQFHDTLHRTQFEAFFRASHIFRTLLQLGQNGISLVAMVVLIILCHWLVAALLFLAALPLAFVYLRYANKLYQWRRDRTSTERQATYLHWLLTRSEPAKELRLFSLGNLFMERFRELRKQLREEKIHIVMARSVTELVTQIGAALGIIGAYAFVTYRAFQGFMTLGDLVMYFQACQRAQGFFQQLLSGFSSLYEDNLFLADLCDFFALKRKVLEPGHPKPMPKQMETGIVFEGVGFRYPNSTKVVLNDINLTIRPGEIVALVGENGAGKTTLIKLLCRLYDPTSGSIRLDGIDLRQFRTIDLRRDISVVFQDYMQYYTTARENIWFGNTDLPCDQERIAVAARQAGADRVIAKLPRGYDTILGKLFDTGEELSTGEWQKLALARAFLRDAQIVVLDEPTSAMGARAELQVFNKFRRLIEGRTAILISHRFSTVRIADRIFVLDEGRIIESGNHEELIARGGTYARLFEIQAQSYR